MALSDAAVEQGEVFQAVEAGGSLGAVHVVVGGFEHAPGFHLAAEVRFLERGLQDGFIGVLQRGQREACLLYTSRCV